MTARSVNSIEEVLKILQVLSNRPESTQRELSLSLGISLGKINFILQSLIKKGLIESHILNSPQNKKRHWYILTPLGNLEKARIINCSLDMKLKEHKDLEEQIRILKKEVYDLKTISDKDTESI